MGSIWDLPGVLEISLFMKHILNRQVSLYIVLLNQSGVIHHFDFLFLFCILPCKK